MQLRKAERKKAKLRIWFSGPSGSGKTFSALNMAHGMIGDWTKIALIDSENGSWELYSNLGEYNVLTIEAPYTPEKYIEAIKTCENAGMEAIIIDSTSHEWDGEGGCLQLNEKLASAKFKGNTWAAWSETTPRHQKFIEAIVTSKCHILTTARSKTDTIQTEDKKIKKVGTKEIQREGFEYELTANFNIDRDHHLAIASKDRTGLFIDRDPFLITDAIGKEIMDWNQSGVDGEALEAARLAQEEVERIALEEKEKNDRENLYNSLIAEMQSVKFIDDLAVLWNTKFNPNKAILWEAYINDLTERKDAIKIELTKTPPKAEVKTPPVAEKKEDQKTPVAPAKTAEPPKVAPVTAPAPVETTTPATDTPPAEVSMITLYRERIRSTSTIEELEIVKQEIESAQVFGDLTETDYGVIKSNVWIWETRLNSAKTSTPNPTPTHE